MATLKGIGCVPILLLSHSPGHNSATLLKLSSSQFDLCVDERLRKPYINKGNPEDTRINKYILKIVIKKAWNICVRKNKAHVEKLFLRWRTDCAQQGTRLCGSCKKRYVLISWYVGEKAVSFNPQQGWKTAASVPAKHSPLTKCKLTDKSMARGLR